MIYAKQLRENLARVAVQIRALTDKAKNDNNRGLTVDEAAEFDRMEADYSSIEASIRRAERADVIENDLRRVNPDQLRDEFPVRPGDAKNQDQHGRVFAKYIRSGVEGLDSDDRRFLASRINNTMSTTTGSQGGYTVPEGFSKMLEEATLWFGGIDGSGVEVVTTETGNPFPWPTDNDTSNMGEVVGQNDPVTPQDTANFDRVVFGAYIFSSKLVKVPLALMQDSYFNLDAYLAKKLGIRLGRIKNRKYTVGSGTNEPTGLQTAAIAAANVYTPANGNSTGITYDSFIELEHAVDPSYRNNPTAKFMFADSTLKVVKKLKDGSLRPLWQPALSGSLATGAPQTILDHAYIINNDMPAMGASAYSILFGDIEKFKVRKVKGDVSVVRLVERYAEYMQVGFIAFERSDSNLLDAGTHPVAVYRNSAS